MKGWSFSGIRESLLSRLLCCADHPVRVRKRSRSLGLGLFVENLHQLDQIRANFCFFDSKLGDSGGVRSRFFQ